MLDWIGLETPMKLQPVPQFNYNRFHYIKTNPITHSNPKKKSNWT